MRSRLYECDVLHARLKPRRHTFVYRIFLFALDLDELDLLSERLRLFSSRSRALYRFSEDDYLPIDRDGPAERDPGAGRASSLKMRVLRHLRDHGIDPGPGSRVELVTLPRILGYQFNPVSFYYCFDRGGNPVASIAEVTNTFREVKPYVLGPGYRDGTHTFRRRVPKHFYVSPFSDVDVAFDFSLQPPGGRLRVRIDDYTGDERTLISTLRGTRVELTDRALARFAVKYPLLSLRVIALIHWQAFRLYLKRVRWFPKDARPEDQRDLYRPHRSPGRRPTSFPA